MVMNIIAAVLTVMSVAGSIFAYRLEKGDGKHEESGQHKKSEQ